MRHYDLGARPQQQLSGNEKHFETDSRVFSELDLLTKERLDLPLTPFSHNPSNSTQPTFFQTQINLTMVSLSKNEKFFPLALGNRAPKSPDYNLSAKKNLKKRKKP
jgi:hypothetical protein